MRNSGSDAVDDLLVLQAQEGDLRSMEELVRRCSGFRRGPSSHGFTRHVRNSERYGSKVRWRTGMNDEEVTKMVEDGNDYDEAKEDSLLRMAGEFYSRRMGAMTAVAWANSLVMLALAVFCAVRFFRTDHVKDAILYAVIFLTAVIWIAGVKTLAWMTLYRKAIARDIRRREIRLLAANKAGRPGHES